VRQEWRVLLEAYFRERTSLVGLFITVDVRRGLNDLDQVMLAWSRDANVAAAILLTKADKLSRSARLQRRRAIAMTLPEDLPLILFSAPGRLGLDEARDQLLVWLGKASHRETSE
jgi:GTP-binding protein EngB required for normal cell division